MALTENYRVIGGSYIDFIDEIDRSIENGWTPVGGVCVTRHGIFFPEVNFYQAMVKYD